MRLRCPTEGTRVATSEVNVAEDQWHQITAMWDNSTPGAPTCSLWVDKDSSGAPDATVSGSGMVTDPGNVDGVMVEQDSDNTAIHIDMLQVDDTETDLVDVFGNDCRE
jgi:hypothetical protein